MDIKSLINDDVMYIFFNGELDEYSAGFVRDYMENAFKSNDFNDVVLDFKGLEFMDSTGIGVLIGRYKKLHQKSKRIFISNANSTIEKIINMSGIYEIMPKIS